MREHSRNLADAILRKVHRTVAVAVETRHHLAVLDVPPDDEAAAVAPSWFNSKRFSVKRGSLAAAAKEGQGEADREGAHSEAEGAGGTPHAAGGKGSRKHNLRIETPL